MKFRKESHTLLVLIALFFFGVTLGSVYEFAKGWIGRDPRFGPLVVNAVLVLPAWLYWRTHRETPKLWAYLLSGALLGLSCLILVIESVQFQTLVEEGFFLQVLLIPVVEEIVFRGGVGAFLQKVLGDWSGAYVGALFFAWMHTMPHWSQLSSIAGGVPLGPLLLGVAAQWLVGQTGSLKPAILLHAGGNAFAMVYHWFLSDNLPWLEIFFLRGLANP